MTDFVPMAARSGFDDELEAMTIECGELADEVRRALHTAVSALLDNDPQLARDAASIEGRIIERSRELDQRCATALVLQSPVASDLRLIVALIRLAAELDRSAHLAGHIARQVLRVDALRLPEELRYLIAHIAALVDTVYGLAVTAFRTRDERLAADISAADDRVDEAVEQLAELIITVGDAGSITASEVMNLALLTRYLERIADHAVTMARRTLFVVGATT